jgi:hypothetical protein
MSTTKTRNTSKKNNLHNTDIIPVNSVLTEMILQRKEKTLKDLKGKVHFSDGYDYKSLRK